MKTIAFQALRSMSKFGAEEIPIYYDTETVKGEFEGVCKELKIFGLDFRLYDLLMGYWERKSDRDLVNFIDPMHPVENAIEFGVGTGYLLRLLAKKYPNAAIRGSDLSLSMLQASRDKLVKHGHSPDKIAIVRNPLASSTNLEEREGGSIALVQEDCRNIHAASESQDLIASSYLLDLLSPSQIREVLSEAERLLRPKGKAYLMTLTSDIGNDGTVIGDLEEKYFRIRNGFYAVYYRSEVLRRVSHALFEGYYTHCRPIHLSSYVKDFERLAETRSRNSYVRICGMPYLPVKIIEVTRQ